MARRRFNSGKFAENFAKSFTTTLSALARAKYYDSLMEKNKGLSDEEMKKRLAGGSAAASSGSAGSGRGTISTDPVSENMEPHQKAFLNAIAAPESGGRYDIRYTPNGGTSFSSYDAHPGIKEAGPAGPSSAAGRYQFLKSTWDSLPAEAKGDGKFTPQNQDKAAWWYAQQQYKAQTGRSLDADLKEKGFTPEITKALGPTWHGLKDNPGRATTAYNSSVKRYSGSTETAKTETAPAAKADAAVPAAPAAKAEAKAEAAPAAKAEAKAEAAPPTEAPAEAPAKAPAEAPESGIPAAPAPVTPRLPMMLRSTRPLGSANAEAPAEVAAEPKVEVPAETSPAPEKQSSLESDALGLSENRSELASNDSTTDERIAQEDALELGYGDTLFSATGGPVPEVEQEPSLDDAIGAALRGVQAEYGLGQERSALPGTDPERQSDMAAFARNEGAMTPEDFKKVIDTVDPEGRMPVGEANSLALQKIYSHYAKSGDEDMAQGAASSVLQASRANSMKLGSLALAAMEQGDMAGAGKALIMSYNQIPDGRSAKGQVDQSGNGMVEITDTRTGKPVQQMRINPQMLKMAAAKLSDGSEFYSHLSRLAPSKAAPRKAFYAGGPVDPNDPSEENQDAADAEVAQDAALAQRDSAENEADLPAVGAIETSGQLSASGLPKEPELIDMTGMNTAQRAQATAINNSRRQVYAQEMQNYRQGEVEARQQRGRAEQEQYRQRGELVRQKYTSDRDDSRKEFELKKMAEAEAARTRAADALATKQHNQMVERDEMGRMNGKTYAGMRADLAEKNAPLLGAVDTLATRAAAVRPGRTYSMPEAAMGEGGQYFDPGEGALQMPEGTNTPRNLDEKLAVISGSFEREFGAAPADQAAMIKSREPLDRAVRDRENVALSNGYLSSKRDRAKLEDDLDKYFDDEMNGAFTRNLLPGEARPEKGMLENGKLFFGDQVSPDEKASMKTWAFKLATANPDLPVTQAARAVVKLTGVDPKKPDASPNFVVDIDEKTGVGRVKFKDGSLSFNLDPESLEQTLMYRKLRADYFEKQLKNPEPGDKKLWEKTLDVLRSLNKPRAEGKSDPARRREAIQNYTRSLGTQSDMGPSLSGALPVSPR